MEYFGDSQDFDEDALPDFVPLDAGNILLMMKVMNLFRKEMTNKIIIHPLRCMLTFQNTKSKRLMLIISRKNLGKEKPLYGRKNIDEILLTYLKERDTLYEGGSGLTNNQQKKKRIYP